MKNKTDNASEVAGQALIALVLIVSITAIIFTHIATLSFTSMTLANETAHAEALLMKSEGYLENAAIRYLRDTTYTGESLIEGEYSCTITVVDEGGLDRDIETICTKHGRTKKVGLMVSYVAGIFQFSPIQQRP